MRNILLPLDQLARAAATDKANRRMRRQGRTEWSLEDYNAAVAEYYRIMKDEHGNDAPPIPHCRQNQLT